MIITYPDKLLYLLKTNKVAFIPKKIPTKQKHFKLYHKYYVDEFVPTGYFKITDIYSINDIQYVTLSFSDDLFWSIPNEIPDCNAYELIYNNNDINNKNILNTNESYPGYQILYWFYNRNNLKYSEFGSYVNDNGKSRVQESCNYFLYADFRNGKYINPRVKLDRRNKNVRGQENIEDI